MTPLSVALNGLEPLIAIAAILTALGVIGMAGMKVYKVVHRVDQALGVDKQGRSLAERMDKVEHELFPNGGSSIKDQVTRLEKSHASYAGELRVVRDLLTQLVERR